MKNKAFSAFEPLIGEWEYTMYNAWFLESMETQVKGKVVIEWVHNAFICVRGEVDAKPDDVWIIGYSDAREKYELFYYDQRGVSRIFDMTFNGKDWAFSREDKDFYQKFTAQITPGKIQAVTEASEDKGKTWRKDFDMTYVKVK